MPHYISLIRWTSQGRMGLPAWRDRVEDGEREIEEAGGKLVGVWVTLGRYDVVDFPDYAAEGFAYQLDRADDDPTAVVVHLHAALTKADQTSVGEQDFEVRTQAADNRVGAIVDAFRKASDDSIAQLIAWTEANATQPTV